jgi:nucleoside 2-deoxyribosyltransferase
MSSTPLVLKIPAELSESIERFRKDHPTPQKVAFIMMRFGRTKAHHEIVTSLRDELALHGIKAVRADDKDYHDDLFSNILTFIYGCSFGIAVFERIEEEEFNPNVALEVGYLMALRKPVLLLKDRTLKNLTTDLIGKLYKTFDPQIISESLGPQIQRWLKDKGIIKSEKEQQREGLAFTEFVTAPYWNSLSRVSGKSLDDLFTALRETKALEEFLARCFPAPNRRKVFLEAFSHGNEREKLLDQANAVRRILAVPLYALLKEQQPSAADR